MSTKQLISAQNILKQLPVQIEFPYEIITAKFDYKLSYKELIEEGDYDHAYLNLESIMDKLVLPTKQLRPNEIHMIRFKSPISTENIFKTADILGLRPLTFWELLALYVVTDTGIAFTDEHTISFDRICENIISFGLTRTYNEDWDGTQYRRIYIHEYHTQGQRSTDCHFPMVLKK